MTAMDTENEGLLVDYPWVSRMLGISEKSVRALVDAGRLPGVVRLGRLVRFNRVQVMEWIDRGCPTAAPAR